MIYYGQQPEFSGILARHERIHAIARTAKALLDAGNHAEVIHLGDALEMENRLMIGEINELVRERHTPSVDYSRRAGAIDASTSSGSPAVSEPNSSQSPGRNAAVS